MLFGLFSGLVRVGLWVEKGGLGLVHDSYKFKKKGGMVRDGSHQMFPRCK